MRYLAILKDSLLETIDSKVFLVVGVISLLAIGLMATVSLTPNPSSEGFQNITARFPDGAQVADIPIVGKIKATPSFTEYSVQDIKGVEGSPKPWEAEYEFTIQARDMVPLGTRIVALQQVWKEEEEKEQREKTGRMTRARKFSREVEQEVERIKEREEKKGGDRMETQQKIVDTFMAYLIDRLESEVKSMPKEELQEFVKNQLESQGNWKVTEVRMVDLPDAERKIKIKTKVPEKKGEDVLITTKEVDGEVNKFVVKVTPRGATYRAWPHKATMLFGAVPLGNSVLPGAIVSKISSWIISTLGAPAIMLLSCIITAFYIPNMLRKGTIDLLLSKPVSRPGLLTYKYIGGLTFMLINTVVLVVGLWVVLGLRTSVWEPAFLYAIPILTFEFALFYALSTLAAVLTRSPIVCILGCVVMWAMLWGLGWAFWLSTMMMTGQPDSKKAWYNTTADVAHGILPHYLDLDWLGDKELKYQTLPTAERGNLETNYGMFSWSESFLVTAIWILGLLGFACWRFTRQDY